MKKIASLLLSFLGLTTLPLLGGPGITVTTTFDYPGTGNSTFPFGINKAGDIAGYYVDASGVTRGFTRTHTGVFSDPIVEPNDDDGFTRALGINARSSVVGDFITATDGEFHGFTLRGGSYTQFDVRRTAGTELFGINDAGDFAGAIVDSTSLEYAAFVDIAGVKTVVAVPIGSTFSSAHGINNADQAVGNYIDSAGVSHGFLLNSDSTVTAPIDYPGATSTVLQGINDHGFIVGRYNNADGVLHAFVLKMPSTLISYDYPGATATSFNDINSKNAISARYTDTLGVAHGFIGQLQ